MKLQNKFKPSSDQETVITIHDAQEYAYVSSTQLPVMRLLRQICEGDTGRMVFDGSDFVECAIDKRHISLNEKAYSPRQ